MHVTLGSALRYIPPGRDIQATLERIAPNYCHIMKARGCCRDCKDCEPHLIQALKGEAEYWQTAHVSGDPKAKNWYAYWAVALRSLAREISEQMIERIRAQESIDLGGQAMPQETRTPADILEELTNLTWQPVPESRNMAQRERTSNDSTEYRLPTQGRERREASTGWYTFLSRHT